MTPLERERREENARIEEQRKASKKAEQEQRRVLKAQERQAAKAAPRRVAGSRATKRKRGEAAVEPVVALGSSFDVRSGSERPSSLAERAKSSLGSDSSTVDPDPTLRPSGAPVAGTVSDKRRKRILPKPSIPPTPTPPTPEARSERSPVGAAYEDDPVVRDTFD